MLLITNLLHFIIKHSKSSKHKENQSLHFYKEMKNNNNITIVASKGRHVLRIHIFFFTTPQCFGNIFNKCKKKQRKKLDGAFLFIV